MAAVADPKEFSASTAASLPREEGESEPHSTARPTRSSGGEKGATESGLLPGAETHGRSGATFRFNVFRSEESRNPLCVCQARDRRHALKIARQMFVLGRTAYAVPEVRRTWN